MTLDEATRARLAAVKLEQLYNAYRATSRANAIVLQRIAATIAESDDLGEAERNRVSQRIVGDVGLSRENDLVFADRAAQLRRRIKELDGFEP